MPASSDAHIWCPRSGPDINRTACAASVLVSVGRSSPPSPPIGSTVRRQRCPHSASLAILYIYPS